MNFSPRKPKSFAKESQTNQTSIVNEPPIPFFTLVKLVAVEDISNEKIRTLNWPFF